jgi:CDP-diglyceride synthetase
MRAYIAISTGISIIFVALLASAIHESQGTWPTVLYCAIGVAAIWIFGYLRGRLLGWTGPGSKDGDRTGREQ